ncbi:MULTISPECIES: hypothetical protein [Rhodoplanes]|uniref:hypothetical protein n=1 Tax=Rhodoplanes TaxID=29407 RepID=UPI00101CF4C4|nr:hypothetical protein [Rhodoplanes serenus]
MASIIRAMQSGERLTRTLRHKRTGECEITFALEPSGKTVSRRSGEIAIRTRFVEPLQDGLFGPDTSQTYRATAP